MIHMSDKKRKRTIIFNLAVTYVSHHYLSARIEKEKKNNDFIQTYIVTSCVSHHYINLSSFLYM